VHEPSGGSAAAVAPSAAARLSPVHRSLTIATAGVLLAAASLAGCGLDDRPSGVAAVASEELDLPPPTPSTTAAAVPARRLDPEDAALAEEVETLVAPRVARPSTIAVVGDSLTRSAEDEITVALVRRGMHVVAIDALESRRMSHGGQRLPPGTEAVDAIRADGDPGMWVIALGTNDVASDRSLNDFRTEMREVLDRIPVDDPVIWVDLWIGGDEEIVARANRMIRVELTLRSGGSAVVDWYSRGEDDGVITADGVHLTPAGQELFADSIAVAVDELFAS